MGPTLLGLFTNGGASSIQLSGLAAQTFRRVYSLLLLFASLLLNYMFYRIYIWRESNA